MKKTLSIVLCVLLVLLAVACSPETHEHDYKLVEEKSYNATCSTPGLEYWECECGARQSLEVAPNPNAHVMVLDEDNEKNKAATCSETGLEVYVCKYADYGCEKTEERTLAKVSTNHPAGKTIFKSTKVAATCASTGIDIVECTACGEKNAEQITAKTTDHYYLDKDDSSKRHTVEQTDIVSWEITDEPNAFLKGKKKGKCPNCGEVAIPSVDVDYASSEILGTWALTDGTTSGTTPTYDYYTFTVKCNESGIYTVDAYETNVKSGVAATEKLETSEADFVTAGIAESGYELKNGARAFRFKAGTDYYYLTLAKSGTSDTDCSVYLEICLDADGTVDVIGKPTVTSHTHTWTRTSKSKIGDTFHYVDCSGCSIKNLEQNHKVSNCSVCGDTSKGWYSVEVTYLSGAKADGTSSTTWTEKFYLKNGDSFEACTNPSSSDWTPADRKDSKTNLGKYNSILFDGNEKSSGTNLYTNKTNDKGLVIKLGANS